MLQAITSFHKKDIAWTDAFLYKTPFHVAFWVQKRIREAIIRNANFAHGTLLDVGCGRKPYELNFSKYVDRYFGMEYAPESGYRGNRADVASDASAMPFADQSIDAILCTEVMEHVENPEKVIEEFSRILKPNGIVITTAPFFYPIHDEYDFFRYSDKGIAKIMERHGLEIVKIEPLSGTGLTVAIMFNFYLFELGFMWTKWLYPVGIILRPLLWLLISVVNVLGWVMEKAIPSKHMAFNHLTVSRKSENFE